MQAHNGVRGKDRGQLGPPAGIPLFRRDLAWWTRYLGISIRTEQAILDLDEPGHAPAPHRAEKCAGARFSIRIHAEDDAARSQLRRPGHVVGRHGSHDTREPSGHESTTF
jgi:hypothetical protein